MVNVVGAGGGVAPPPPPPPPPPPHDARNDEASSRQSRSLFMAVRPPSRAQLNAARARDHTHVAAVNPLHRRSSLCRGSSQAITSLLARTTKGYTPQRRVASAPSGMRS